MGRRIVLGPGMMIMVNDAGQVLSFVLESEDGVRVEATVETLDSGWREKLLEALGTSD